MGIRVAHDAVATPVVASYAAGVGRAKERDRKQKTDILRQGWQQQHQLTMQKNQNQLRKDLQEDEQNFRREQQNAQNNFRAGLQDKEQAFVIEQGRLGRIQQGLGANTARIGKGLEDGSIEFADPNINPSIAMARLEELDRIEMNIRSDPNLDDAAKQQQLQQVYADRQQYQIRQLTPEDMAKKREDDFNRNKVVTEEGTFLLGPDGKPQLIAPPASEVKQRQENELRANLDALAGQQIEDPNGIEPPVPAYTRDPMMRQRMLWIMQQLPEFQGVDIESLLSGKKETAAGQKAGQTGQQPGQKAGQMGQTPGQIGGRPLPGSSPDPRDPKNAIPSI
jgi:hypothetical protein